ncbi:MAG: hypothetical protein AAGB26_18335 [Planctomycetota bacterium]
MTRQTVRWPLIFALTVLVCGGGCMTLPFIGQRMEDMTYIGLDKHTHARLRGEVNPRPNDPGPVSHLSGRLLLYQLLLPRQRSYYYELASWVTIKESDLALLEELEGVDSVGYLGLHWEEPDQDQPYTGEPTVTPAQFREAMLGAAQVRDGDLILVYTAHDKSDQFDPTLSLASILTLGFAPTKLVTVETNIEAALVDAHSGFIYAVSSGEGDGWRIASMWSRESKKYPAAADAGAEAFGNMANKLKDAWPTMRQVYR